MPKRLYLSKVIGDGLTPETAFRPACADLPGRWDAELPLGPDHRPRHGQCLAVVHADDQREHLKHADLYVLPDMDPDGPIASVSLAQRVALRNRLVAAGLDGDAMTGKATLAEALGAVLGEDAAKAVRRLYKAKA